MNVLGRWTMAAALVAGSLSVAQAQDTTKADKDFLAAAAQDSVAEINYAKLALAKTGDPNIKAFATKMIHDHEMLIKDTTPISKKLDVKEANGPSILDKAKYEELKLQSGISFDRAYVEAMVKDHNDDLKKFIEEEQKTSNPELKAIVAKGEKVIREHTMMIDDLAHKGGISTPAMPQ